MQQLQTHHVGVVVSDLDEAVSFYRDALGLSVTDEFTLAEDGIGTAIGVDGATGDFVHLDAGGDEGDGTRIELIEYDPAGEDCIADAINQVGAKHVGFAVDDIGEFYENLPDEVEPISDPQAIEIDTSILFFRDPEGNFVEVVEV
ncbi:MULTISPECIES: VOC family protein [Halorussus]|uniref:VOC family protein n=1 Tax=Halorussus TaxID=1070314 RepID=UPI000E21284E|nr:MULTISPECIES: VOC family protein [Halorussus]NHN60079.1 VOC family protein [Halorussus sp. JP-T4]